MTIEEGVQTIGVSAFVQCTNLTTITLPDSVREIFPWAFAECSRLETIYLGSHIERVDMTTFDECSALQAVYVPKGCREQLCKTDSTETIEYYKDRNGRCLANCGLSLHIPIADHYCSHWYTISEDGLVVINTYYLLSYLSLAFIASVLPSIVWLYSLYKIIFYLVQFWHTYRHNSH